MLTNILSCDILLNSLFTLFVTPGAAQTLDTLLSLSRPTEEDDEDAIKVTEEQEQEREQPEFSIIPPRRRDTISFKIDDPKAEDLIRREYYSKD
ncbi:hypothetical protein N7486_002442 [Penicillium sp. IBT 16267x]|nr:hypothetical protein N7486_002442 [Penicillium sp. IBT 16267x]